MESRYLLTLRYLGYGYRGWQKQPQVKTVQGTLERTILYLTGMERIRTLAAGRTDAGVSAEAMPVMLITDAPIDPIQLLQDLRQTLPIDIEALALVAQADTFSILESVQEKEYRYRFAERPLHPFTAPHLAPTGLILAPEAMLQGAGTFLGSHDFRAYTYQPKPDTVTMREIVSSELIALPPGTLPYQNRPAWEFRVRARGFLRHQVRLMAGTLMAIGQGHLSLAAVRESLNQPEQTHHYLLAPAEGLTLHAVVLA